MSKRRIKLAPEQQRMRLLAVLSLASIAIASATGPTVVTLTSPTSGQTISGVANLTASVQSFLPIQRVEYILDGKVVATWSNALTAPSNFRILP